MNQKRNPTPLRSGLSFRLELGNKPKRSGEHAILLRITENRRSKRIYTEIDVRKEWWDGKKEEVRRKDEDATRKNLRLHDILGQLKQLKLDSPQMGAEDVMKILRGERNPTKVPTFIEYAYEYYLKDKPFNTRKNTRTILNKVEEFAGHKDVTFAEITLDFVNRFEVFLRRSYLNNDTTVDINLSKVKAVINHAIRHGVIGYDMNPFRMYRIKEGKPRKDRLADDEVESFASVELALNTIIWHTRNYWMFAYYSAGVRFSDVASLRWSNIVQQPDGRVYVSYDMQKTGKYHTVLLPKKALAILNLYEHRRAMGDTALVFPILNPKTDFLDDRSFKVEISRKNALINKYLKKVAERAGITKRVTFHTARHSFADNGRKRVSLYDISKLLGHSRLAITEQYFAKIDHTSMNRAMVDIFPDAESPIPLESKNR
ncbi:tyrosine-type recombinase/integrase [Tellurirhabdus rosea]|uniref:tyrosine-type recombinase/integrase n=1 Tax=Tellurirhabdus rosea TaxID=2674997 RepID=UPI0022563950|nr:site-specific integrase [Tellurirhabdus rosea]